MSTTTAARTDGDRFVLRDVSWERYVSLRDDPTQYRVKMTYFRGVLELMSPSGPHETIKRVLEQLIEVWCDVHDIPYKAFGSTTYRREDQAAGLEPDSCYYIQGVDAIGERVDLDLMVDPPPDLAIEVDISSRSSRRLPIYAALGVPEVWRTNGEWLHMYQLVGGGYLEIEESESLPGLMRCELVDFLRRSNHTHNLQFTREFRVWAASQKPSA
jgi:Uma2 family endonuclease